MQAAFQEAWPAEHRDAVNRNWESDSSDDRDSSVDAQACSAGLQRRFVL